MMRSSAFIVLLGAALCVSVPIDECPTYFQQGNEAFDQQKWDAMAACAKGLDGQELTDYLNSHQNFYKAEFLHPEMRGAVMQQQTLARELRLEFRATTIRDYDDTPIPKKFDLEKEYRQCAHVIGHITNQGLCGDCWAHAATGVMSDRICIGSNGTQRAQLSATELLSCCENCTKHSPEFGDADHKCSGGRSILGYKYWVSEGVVTEQCQPVNSSLTTQSDPPCSATCVDSEDFQAAKHYGVEAYYIGGEGDVTAELIQRELMANGSVSAAYDIYEDFFLYQSGIYIPAADKTPYRHSVRIIGWGEQRGIPYWRVANSWGGNKQEDGYFRIIRGINAAGFEEWIDAATPKL